MHFTDCIPHYKFIAALQVSQAQIYLTSQFVPIWSLLETMNAGAAIIACDTESAREVMCIGETGILVDFFDLQASLTQVDRLLDDADLRDQLGQLA